MRTGDDVAVAEFLVEYAVADREGRLLPVDFATSSPSMVSGPAPPPQEPPVCPPAPRMRPLHSAGGIASAAIRDNLPHVGDR